MHKLVDPYLKTCLVVSIFWLLILAKAEAAEYHTFSYKTADSFKISVRADSREEAFLKASKECFRILTKGVYPGEKKGLEYIDICGNGK